jgi:hypothetical protein
VRPGRSELGQAGARIAARIAAIRGFVIALPTANGVFTMRSATKMGVASTVATALRGAMEQVRDVPSTAASLDEWREAERAVAVARRGRVAAEAAAAAAAAAADAATATAAAATATADAARQALNAATAAEDSAAKTAAAARAAVQLARADSAESETDLARAEVEEATAHDRYRQAAGRAASRDGRDGR